MIGLGALLLPAGPASAHGGNGGSSSDYRAEITGYTNGAKGDGGFELQIVQLGNRLELHRTTAHQVVVLGYQGEPYLRLDADGVWENESSPAAYLNRDRYAEPDPTGECNPRRGAGVEAAARRRLGPLARPPRPLDVDDPAPAGAGRPGPATRHLLRQPRRPARRRHAGVGRGEAVVGSPSAPVDLARPRRRGRLRGPGAHRRPPAGRRHGSRCVAAAAALVGRGPGTGWLVAGVIAVALAVAGVVSSAAPCRAPRRRADRREPAGRRSPPAGCRSPPGRSRWRSGSSVSTCSTTR